MKIPDSDTIKLSAVSHLRELGAQDEADLLSRCRLEIGDTGQRYVGSTEVGLNITLRCRATDLARFKDQSSFWDLPSSEHITIKSAIESIFPAQLKVHDLSARTLLVDRTEFEKSELERLIEAQIDLMIAVATGGSRIQQKNQEYKERRELILNKLQAIEKIDPNPFVDLWAWYGRWSSGDLPSYQSRRVYIRALYRDLLEDLSGDHALSPSEPSRKPTGWEKVDRTIDKIIASLDQAKNEEEFQAIGLLCRECLISLAQAVFDPMIHKPADGTEPSETDAYRYFLCEFSGAENEALRRHAKAALVLANGLQHKRTAKHREAALCSEATRTVVNIVAITSGKR